MIRYAITKIGKDGMRTLALSNQGRNHFDTQAEAERVLEAILSNSMNSPDTLNSVYGDVSKMEVRPIECYAHGDAKTVYFD